MQRTAVIWVVYTMTNSAFMVGVASFAEQIPSFLFSIPGGALADRHNKYKLLMWTQVLSALQAVVLTVLVFYGYGSVWVILGLSFLLGIVNAFDIPARQPMVHDIIRTPEDLPNAIALNSTLNNLARLVGPAVSGMILEKMGAVNCFLINAISYVAVISCLVLMKLPAYEPSVVQKKMWSDMKEGFRYIARTKNLRMIILLLTCVSFLVMPYSTLLPVYAREVFKGNALTFGYINSFLGLGAVIGAFFVASLKAGANLRKLLLINTVILGLSLMVFSHLTHFPAAMCVAVVCGFGTMAFIPVCNTILQMESDKNMRGRVISYFAMTTFGMMPLGSLAIGAISHVIGAQNSILCQGALGLIIALMFFRVLNPKSTPKS